MRRRSHQPIRLRVLGRLPIVIAVALALAGCDDKEKVPHASRSRSQAVAATTSAPVAAPVQPPPSASHKAPDKPKRKLCADQLGKPGKEFPDAKLSRVAAPGTAELSGALSVGKGWTWVNFWAAWCAPCKEEMPRLVSWEKKLRAGGAAFSLVFVSLDDDGRQLSDFLNAQPETGVKRSYWLKEGEQREKWLAAIGMEDDPELPVQLLVDPSGKIRCTVSGAVEDADFDTIKAIVASGR